MFVPNTLDHSNPESIADTAADTILDPNPRAHLVQLSFLGRISYGAAIVLPLLGLVAGIVLLWGRGFGWVYGGLLAGGYFFSAFGITVGYHRLFCHSSFKTNAFVKFMLGVMGSTAVEGSIIKWCSVHRCHHQHSDDQGDPHSPHIHGPGIVNMFRGLWHAHVGWMFAGEPGNLSRYVGDLVRDRVVLHVSKLWGLWAILGLVVPAVLGGLLTMSWMGVLLGFLWGGLARLFIIHHVTWSINSVCHIWGYRPFRSHDHSRNNVVFGVLGLGEGWHNNHHAFPTSARHGLRWWEIDFSYLFIRGLELIGWAWDVHVPSQTRMASKMAT